MWQVALCSAVVHAPALILNRLLSMLGGKLPRLSSCKPICWAWWSQESCTVSSHDLVFMMSCRNWNCNQYFMYRSKWMEMPDQANVCTKIYRLGCQIDCRCCLLRALKKCRIWLMALKQLTRSISLSLMSFSNYKAWKSTLPPKPSASPLLKSRKKVAKL